MVFGPDGNLYKALKSSKGKNPVNNPNIWEDILTELNNIVNDIKENLFPIGGICAWPSLNNFPKFGTIWFECNGNNFDSSLYPELYSILGSSKLPDYRGLFLRGYGRQSLSDRDVYSDSIGVIQGDGIRVESTNIKIKSGNMFLYRWYQSFDGDGPDNDYTACFGNYIRKGAAVTGIEIGNLGQKEDSTRPVNTAVRWLIKAK